MKLQRVALAVTALNLALLLVVAFGRSTAAAPDDPVLRIRALELVDDAGQVRAQLDVEQSGEVVFRLRDPDGTIRVKLGAGTDGSGLLLLDETTEPAVHLVARRHGTPDDARTTSIRMQGAGGRQRTLKPGRN